MRTFNDSAEAFIYFASCNVATLWQLTGKSVPQCQLGRQLSITWHMIETARLFGYNVDEVQKHYKDAVREVLGHRPEIKAWMEKHRKELPCLALLEI